MTLPFEHVPTREELDVALDEAAQGMARTDTGLSAAIEAVLDRIADKRAVDPADEEEAYRLLAEMEDEQNIADAEEDSEPAPAL